MASAEAVGKLGGPDAEQGLISALSNSTDAIRAAAADALGQMRAAKAVPELIAALSDRDPTVRWRAAVALGLIGDAAALPALRIASVDPGIARPMRQRVSDAASQAIDRIVSNNG
jgi:HEAT repeat protein